MLRFERVLASTTDVVFIYVFCIMSTGIPFYSVVICLRLNDIDEKISSF